MRLLKRWREIIGLWKPAWDDLTFPSQGINPPGGVSDPARSQVNGLLQFSASATNMIAGVAQLKHGWKHGTTVEPHLHYRAATEEPGGNSRWLLEYRIYNPNDGTVLGAYTELYLTIGHVSNDRGNYVIGFESDIPMPGMGDSAMIEWRLSRLGGDALDTFGGLITLVDIDFHFQRFSIGSPTSDGDRYGEQYLG